MIGILRMAAFYLFSAVMLPAIMLAVFLRPGSKVYYWPFALWWIDGMLKIFGVQVTVEGQENAPVGGDFVMLANHRSHLDSVAIASALRQTETRWVSKAELRRVPVFGRALQVTGQIFINRADPGEAIRQLQSHLGDRGVSIVFFPEGSRAPTLSLRRFKKGGAAFAISAGLPLVPVAVSGTERCLPKGALVVKPGAVRVLVGRPIDVRGFTDDDRERLTELAREAIQDLLAEVESPDALTGGDTATGSDAKSTNTNDAPTHTASDANT